MALNDWSKICTIQDGVAPSLNLKEMQDYMDMFTGQVLVILPVKTFTKHQSQEKWDKIKEAAKQAGFVWSTIEKGRRTQSNTMIWPMQVDGRWVILTAYLLNTNNKKANINVYGTVVNQTGLDYTDPSGAPTHSEQLDQFFREATKLAIKELEEFYGMSAIRNVYWNHIQVEASIQGGTELLAIYLMANKHVAQYNNIVAFVQ